MPWVVKKHLPLAVVVLPIAIGIFSAIFVEDISLEDSVPPVLTCFDQNTSTMRVTTSLECKSPLISLGNSALIESTSASGVVEQLHPILQARFDAAANAANREGYHLYISSGFRNEERQAILFANAIKKYGSETEAAKWVLPPNFSHHPHGLAIDVNYPGDPIGAKWLEANGARFGLCRVYANEWWHFEGVIAPGGQCPKMAPNALVDLR